MKNTRKILVAFVLVLAMMISMATLFVSAADTTTTLYFAPNANWKTQNARFAAYFFDGGETWVDMTDANGDGIYEVEAPEGYKQVIFCRMDPGAAANNWTNKWNQSGDLIIPTDGRDLYTLPEDVWDDNKAGTGVWTRLNSTCIHTNLGDAATCTTAQVCNDCGDPVVAALGHNYDAAYKCIRCEEHATFTVAGSGAHLDGPNGMWDTGNTANDMTYADGVYTKVYENVAKGDDYELKCALDHAWGEAYPQDNYKYNVATDGSTVTVTFTVATKTVDVVVSEPTIKPTIKATYTLVADNMEVNAYKTDGEILHAGTNDFFKIILKNGTKVEESAKEFEEDGSKFTKRLSLGGKINWSNGVVTKTGIEISVKGAATVKIWWICGSSSGERYIAIQDTLKNEIDATDVGEDGAYYIDTLEIPEAGTYYIGNMVNNNYIYKIEVVVDEPHEHTWVDATCTAPKTCSGCNATEGEALGHNCVLDICMVCYSPVPSLVVGENTVVVPPAAVEGDIAYKFAMVYIAEPGTYIVNASEGASAVIFYDPIYAEGSDFSIGSVLGASWNKYNVYADLVAGFYYIGIYGEGEHTVTLATYEPPVDEVKNSVAIGDNHYVVTDALLTTGFEWFALEFEPGTYVVKGGKNLTIFVFYDTPNAELTGDEAYASNLDANTYLFVDEFEFVIEEKGYYWVGFRYDFAGETREFDFNISLKSDPEQPGDETPDQPGDDTPDQPEEPKEELNLFQKILKAITDFFAKIGEFFKNLIPQKK